MRGVETAEDAGPQVRELPMSSLTGIAANLRTAHGRPWLRAFAALLATLTLAACTGSQTGNELGYKENQPGLVVLGDRQDLVVFSLARDLGTGPNRIPLTLLRFDRSKIIDRAHDLAIRYGRLNEEPANNVEDVIWRPWPLGGGAYTFTADFDGAGVWEIHVVLKEPDGPISGKAAIQVSDSPRAPAVGDPAPRTPTKTAETAARIAEITSDPEPNPDFYKVSLDDAIGSGTPVAVTFSTPAFCHTHTCGPQLHVLTELRSRYGDRAHFVHVEIWDNPREMLETGDLGVGVVSPVVGKWNLPTEPWTFLIDGNGIVTARYEAFTTKEELVEGIESIFAPN